MWLDDLSYDEWAEWGSEWWAEQPSEQQREKAAAALAGIKRTRKDEGKAARDNDFLREILLAIISSAKYDSLLPTILTLLESNTPSNLLVGGCSLVYAPASDMIRRHYTAPLTDELRLVRFLYTPNETFTPFDEKTIDPAIRNRINDWIEDMFCVVSYDPSVLMTERSIEILSHSTSRTNTVRFLAEILTFFFRAIHIDISDRNASDYADFIVWELKKRLQKLEIEKV